MLLVVLERTHGSVVLMLSAVCAKSMAEIDSPRVLLERRLRWLVEVLWGSRVFCWWLLSMGLVAMMLSLYLFISANLVLSLTADKKNDFLNVS